MILREYSFGRIFAGGEEYRADLIVYPDRVDPSWRRKVGHSLDPEDLLDVLENPPEVLVIGTGFSGCMVVPEQTLEALREHGIEVLTAKTDEAVAEYNRLEEKDVTAVAALHLTC